MCNWSRSYANLKKIDVVVAKNVLIKLELHLWFFNTRNDSFGSRDADLPPKIKLQQQCCNVQFQNYRPPTPVRKKQMDIQIISCIANPDVRSSALLLLQNIVAYT